ncbi:MAG: CAP domain-containing protein [Bacteroidota bacterium]
MRILLFISFILIFNMVSGQDFSNELACLSDEEYRLYKLVNEYRKEKTLPEIPLSASLCYVAAAHVWDLQTNQPEGGNCNMHSWSDQGPWSACCYTDDHSKAECLWAKPAELTEYDGFGYEVAYYSSLSEIEHSDMALAALDGWKGSPGHHHMIINRYGWKRMKWRAMGVGIYGNFVVVWFGEKNDLAGKPELCP